MQAGNTTPILVRGLGLEGTAIPEITDVGAIGRCFPCSTRGFLPEYRRDGCNTPSSQYQDSLARSWSYCILVSAELEVEGRLVRDMFARLLAATGGWPDFYDSGKAAPRYRDLFTAAKINHWEYGANQTLSPPERRTS